MLELVLVCVYAVLRQSRGGDDRRAWTVTAQLLPLFYDEPLLFSFRRSASCPLSYVLLHDVLVEALEALESLEGLEVVLLRACAVLLVDAFEVRGPLRGVHVHVLVRAMAMQSAMQPLQPCAPWTLDLFCLSSSLGSVSLWSWWRPFDLSGACASRLRAVLVASPLVSLLLALVVVLAASPASLLGVLAACGPRLFASCAPWAPSPGGVAGVHWACSACAPRAASPCGPGGVNCAPSERFATHNMASPPSP